ncbi:hypothetical protein SLS62_009331 [Diatrype stigma]|uniref:Ubiquitin-like domain-containing protein n=1 Tax=Diatrype stigma TaxID=117547 RepID=A0AAN9UEE6_9PEZI
MDPGTILGVVSLALEVSKLMYKTAEGIGSAGRDVRLRADEVDSFVKAAEAVQEVLRMDVTPGNPQTSAPTLPVTRLRAKIEDAITDIIENCRRALDPLRELLRIFEPLVARVAATTTPRPRQQYPGKLRTLGNMIRFYLMHDDVQKYCQAVQASSRSLNLGMTALTLLHTRDAGTARFQTVQVQYSIDMLEPHAAAVRPRPGRSQLGDAAINLHPSGDRRTLLINGSSDAVIEESGDPSSRDAHEREISSPSSEAHGNHELALVSPRQASEDRVDQASSNEGSEEGLGQEEIIRDQVNGVLNKQDVTPADEVLGVTKWLTRKVVRIARETIAAASTETSTARDHLQSSSPSNDTAVRTAGISPSTPDTNQQDEESSRQPKPADLEPIIFRDWNREAYPLPFKQLQDFQEFIRFIVEHCIDNAPASFGELVYGSPHREAIETDQFEVVSPKGLITPDFAPKYWSELIQPGWEVSLRFTGDFYRLSAPPRPEDRPREEPPKEELSEEDLPRQDLPKKMHKFLSKLSSLRWR